MEKKTENVKNVIQIDRYGKQNGFKIEKSYETVCCVGFWTCGSDRGETGLVQPGSQPPRSLKEHLGFCSYPKDCYPKDC